MASAARIISVYINLGIFRNGVPRNIILVTDLYILG